MAVTSPEVYLASAPSPHSLLVEVVPEVLDHVLDYVDGKRKPQKKPACRSECRAVRHLNKRGHTAFRVRKARCAWVSTVHARPP